MDVVELTCVILLVIQHTQGGTSLEVPWCDNNVHHAAIPWSAASPRTDGYMECWLEPGGATSVCVMPEE